MTFRKLKNERKMRCVFIILLTVLFSQAYSQNAETSSNQVPTAKDLINKKLPDFRLKDLRNQDFSSQQLLGKPTLINFWSINCKPCIEEFDQLNKLKEKYEGRVNFIAISEDSYDEVIKVLGRRPFNFQQLINGYNYRKSLHIESLPKNLFLDKNGIVKEIQDGLNFEIDQKTGKPTVKNNIIFDIIIKKIL
jgi:thiol-disulfide isomerase/thioredoxin